MATATMDGCKIEDMLAIPLSQAQLKAAGDLYLNSLNRWKAADKP
jgi:hypothetical protein